MLISREVTRTVFMKTDQMRNSSRTLLRCYRCKHKSQGGWPEYKPSLVLQPPPLHENMAWEKALLSKLQSYPHILPRSFLLTSGQNWTQEGFCKENCGKEPKRLYGYTKTCFSLTQHEPLSQCHSELITQEVVTPIRLWIKQNILIFCFVSILITVLKRPEFIFLQLSKYLRPKIVM